MTPLPSGRPATAQSRRGRGELIIVLTITSVLLGLLSYFALRIYFRNSGVRLGVYFLGYDLGTLRASELPDRIGDIIDTVYDEPIYLRFKNHIWILRYRKHFRLQDAKADVAQRALAIGKDATVYKQAYDWLTLDYPRVDLPFSPQLDRRYTQANMGAKLSNLWPSRISARRIEGGKVQLTFQSGEVDVSDVVSGIERSLETSAVVERRIIDVKPLEKGGVTKIVDPNDPKEGFSAVLATRTVDCGLLEPSIYDSITAAAERINGLLVNPGEVFSFDRTAGTAHFRAGVHPIGLSFLACALYEPLLRVGAKVVERHPHPYYYPELGSVLPGLDAHVSAGEDLIVMNDSSLPLLVATHVDASKITAELRSVQDLPFRVELRTGKVAKVPFRTSYRKLASMRPRDPPKVEVAGIDGIKVRVYRTYLTREEGRREREEAVSTDEYARREQVLDVWHGFKEPKEEVTVEDHPRPRPKAVEVDEPPPADADTSTDDDEDEPARPAHAPTAPAASDDTGGAASPADTPAQGDGAAPPAGGY